MTATHLIIACDNCGARNRLPVERLKDHPVCGKCRSPISVKGFGTPLEVSDQDFDFQVLKSDVPVLVDCWAPWCGPCKGFAPVLESIAAKYTPQLKVVKINVDDNPMISSRYRIRSVPTLMLVKNGKIVEMIAGALPAEHLEPKINDLLR